MVYHLLTAILRTYCFLKKISKEEKLEIDESSLKTVARQAGGDMRAAITDLYILAADKKFEKENIGSLSERSQMESMPSAPAWASMILESVAPAKDHMGRS